jgi:glycosyltransferase involved in cell wall biosynthesis
MIPPPVRVSVGVPIHDAERFLAEAIRSVIDQTFPSWELLLVDDGSTDGSAGIAESFARQHPDRIRVLRHPGGSNRGMSASRNLAIRHSRGEYLAFLDADDVWLPEKLEEQVRELDAHPEAGSLYGRTLYWFGWTGREEDRRRDHAPPLRQEPGTVAVPAALIAGFLRGEITVPCTCSLLVRRSVVERVGGFEERFRELYEDQVFYTKAFLAAPVFLSGGCRERYRQHPDSCCAVAERRGELEAARLRYVRWMSEYLSRTGVSDRGLRGALRREAWRIRHPRLAALLSDVRGRSRP